MAINSSIAVAGEDALASQYNDLRLDSIELGGEYAEATGSGGNYQVSIDSEVTTLNEGLTVKFKANHSFAGSITVDVNGLGGISLSNVNTVEAGKLYIVIYEGSEFRGFQEFKDSSLILQAGKNISQGELVSINAQGQVVPSVRELPAVVDTLINSNGTVSGQRVQILKAGDNRAISHIQGTIELLEVDLSTNSLSIIDSVDYTGFNYSQYGRTMTKLTDSLFAIVYGSSSTIMEVAIVSLAGDTLTIEDTAVVATGVSDNKYITIARVADDRLAVCTDDGSNVVIVGVSYSAGSITVDTANQITRSLASTQSWVITRYNNNEVMFFYQDEPGDDLYRSKITFTGTNPSLSGTFRFTNNTNFTVVVDTETFIGVGEQGSDRYWYSKPGTDSWSSLNMNGSIDGFNQGFNYEGNKYLSIRDEVSAFGGRRPQNGCVLEWSDNKMLAISFNIGSILLVDQDNSLTSGVTLAGTLPNRYNLLYMEGNLDSIQGVAGSDASTGVAVAVNSTGVQGGYAGLTLGNTYYVSLADLTTLTSTPSDIKIGTAISDTEISLNIERTDFIRDFVGNAAVNSRSLNFHMFGLPQLFVPGIRFYNTGNTLPPSHFDTNFLITTVNPGTLQTSPS